MDEINVKITKDEEEKLIELIGYLSTHIANGYEKEYIKTLKSITNKYETQYFKSLEVSE